MTKLRMLGITLLVILGRGSIGGGVFLSQQITQQIRDGIEEGLVFENENDLITNINPAYQGVLEGAGYESALITSFVSPAIAQILERLQGDFTKMI